MQCAQGGEEGRGAECGLRTCCEVIATVSVDIWWKVRSLGGVIRCARMRRKGGRSGFQVRMRLIDN
jgi:hypothetical protein